MPWSHTDMDAGRHEEALQFWDFFPTTPPERGPGGMPEGYESLAATMRNGFYYGQLEMLILEPHFSDSAGVVIQHPGLQRVEEFDFGREISPRVILGFQSNVGAGIELEYWRFNEWSDMVALASDGNDALWVTAGRIPSVLYVDGPGESIGARHHMKIDSASLVGGKDFQMPRATARAVLGVRYVSLRHRLYANAYDASDALIDSLFRSAVWQGAGPMLGVDYSRPIGHTQAELVGGMRSALMLGHLNEVVYHEMGSDFVHIGKDHPLTIFDCYAGVQWVTKIRRCTSLVGRMTFESQYWLRGGSAASAESDFGLYGLVMSLGVTR